MFHAEYSAGSPLRMLVDLRNVVDAALARTVKEGRQREVFRTASFARASRRRCRGRAVCLAP